MNWPEEESIQINLAGTRASGKLGLNGWVAVLDENNEQAQLWFFARRGEHLVMEFDHPATWRRLAGDSDSAISGGLRNTAPAATNALSGPVRHLDLSAEQQPWRIVIQRSHTKPSD